VAPLYDYKSVSAAIREAARRGARLLPLGLGELRAARPRLPLELGLALELGLGRRLNQASPGPAGVSPRT